jgi:hypothetical protein
LVQTDFRTINALKGKWKDVNQEVCRFSGILSNLHQKNESGKTDEDILEDAERLYCSVAKVQSFSFMGPFSILSNRPKWRVNKGKRPQEKESTPGTSPEASPTSAASGKRPADKDNERPPGSKKQKQNLENEKFQSGVIANQRRVAETLERRTKLMEENNKFNQLMTLYNMPGVDFEKKDAFFREMREKLNCEIFSRFQ